MEEIKTKGPTFEEIAVLEKATGGKVAKYEWWTVRGVDGNLDSNFDSYTKPSNEEDILYHGVLENSFLSQGGEYIGDFKQAEWYYEQKLKVYEPYPHGVAIALDENGNIEGYVGYTHRGAGIFRVGDRLFDEMYEPKEEDYTPEQWHTYVNRYNDALTEADRDNDDWWANDIKTDGIKRFISFKMRGSKIIETLEEASQAAINLSKYLS